MSAIDGFVLGVLALAAALGGVWLVTICVRKTWAVANALIDGLREIGKLRQTCEELRDEARIFSGIMAGTYLPNPKFGEGGKSPANPSAAPQAPPPFPTPVFDRFRVKEPPDAKLEDSQVIAPSDEEMAAQERIDNLRELGFDVQEPSDAEGIHAEG